MMQGDELESLLGTRLSDEELLGRVLPVERTLLKKLTLDFNLTNEERGMTIRTLYWFRQSCSYYIHLWEVGGTFTSLQQVVEMKKIFSPMKYCLEMNSRKCFSKENFFGKIRFLLEACDKLKVSKASRRTYLRWLFAFPITPEYTLARFVEHSLYPNNLPYIYMHQLSGFVRRRLVTGKNPAQIAAEYKTFLRELHISQAEAKWFRKRYAGSYGSKQ